MKALFVMRQENDVRYFEPVLSALAERGDRVHVAFPDAAELPGENSFVEDLSRRNGTVSYDAAPEPAEGDRRVRWAAAIRAGLDYLFFVRPEFADSPKLRRRREPEAPHLVRRLAPSPGAGNGARGRALRAVLRAAERAIGPPQLIVDYVERIDPDVVLVVPATRTTDFARAGRRLGIPTGLCVASWDNLTVKGFIHERGDFVTVWNGGQTREAVELHGIPAEAVVTTGAQNFDLWFDWEPSTGREEFCSAVGLDPARPYLLWLGSSEFMTGRKEEAPYVERWLSELRGRPEPGLTGLQLLVRPYPSSRIKQWEKHDWSAAGGGVAVSPLTREKPLDREARNHFYDSIYHSAAVVGINTSALIESAIIGRPVYTLLAPEFRDAQEGTLHFSLISEFGGGILNIARDFDEHARQLSEVLSDPEAVRLREEPRRKRFLEAFVRPHGLERPAAPIFVEAIDAAVAQVTRPSASS